ncbi:MAG: M3 family metallopeptidase [Zoogloeaceae bacterium]|nr:M3 family metallopeptidase [Zoogloeaceae bacterium]
MTHPLLPTGELSLPDFAAISPEQVEPAIRQLLGQSRALIETLSSPATPATWEDFARPLADGLERLSWAWGIVAHFHSVKDIPEWRAAYNAALPEVSRFYSEVGQNTALFEKYKALAASPAFAGLSAARQKVVQDEIRDYRLSGAEIPDEQKPRFSAIDEELSALSAKFSENLLDATNAFEAVIEDEARLAGLPADALAAARHLAESKGQTGWTFTLQAPSYLPVMQYADDRALRAQFYRAYGTRASEFGPEQWDNGKLMPKLLSLCKEKANLLGYANFAELSLVPKMAESPQEALDFLHDLAQKAKPFAQQDWAELQAFARENLGLDDFMPWDAAYAAEKLRQAKYAFSEQDVKHYFVEPNVIAGLFQVLEALYGIHIHPDNATLWHADARFYRIDDAKGAPLGYLCMDLYARPEKRGGAWMNDLLARKRRADGSLQLPIACIDCNFQRPTGDRPATLTHDEVMTLFHEAGHAFHHLLTRIEELGVSGIDGVEWDAVELPSQFMENFCWDWDVLQGMTAHVDTGEKLPRALFDKMIAARNFQSGMQMVRQLEFALFDLRLYLEYDPAHAEDSSGILALLNDVRKEVAVLFPPDWHRFPHSFAHIFSGGYSAGYYSYKWAEVLSADAFSAFEEAPRILDSATGKRFLDEILAQGGARPAMASFIAFRGRKPSPDALLRHNGMVVCPT